MLSLDTTSKTIRIELGGAVTTNQLNYSASWADLTTTTFTPGTTETVSNSLTPVTLVSAPASLVQRRVQAIVIYNKDTVAASILVELKVSSTAYVIFGCTLQSKETLIYEDGKGWQILTTAGKLKTKT